MPSPALDPESLLLGAMAAGCVCALAWIARDALRAPEFRPGSRACESPRVIPSAEETAASIERFRHAVARFCSVENQG